MAPSGIDGIAPVIFRRGHTLVRLPRLRSYTNLDLLGQLAQGAGQAGSLPHDRWPVPIRMMEFKNLDALTEALVGCRLCPRLVAWREQVAREKRAAFRGEEYWSRP